MRSRTRPPGCSGSPCSPPPGRRRPGSRPAPGPRPGTGEVDVAEAEFRARLRAAYLPAWSAFESPERLARAWELAVPLGALHQAVCYRSLVASLQPPTDLHLARSTAWCLEGHGFTQRVDALAAWPVAQAARPLGTG
jgi:hypothetical protein